MNVVVLLGHGAQPISYLDDPTKPRHSFSLFILAMIL